METLSVRPIIADDLSFLKQWLPFGDPAKHEQRLARQEAEEALYLSAWRGTVPVGHVLIKWSGSNDHPFLQGRPGLEDLMVAPDYRRQGVASQLLSVAEAEARRCGYDHIGLSVGIENHPARALYSRCGYELSDGRTFRIHGCYRDEHGRQQRWEEICVYLVKRL